MDYFTRNAGISGMPGLIATLCKYALIWLFLGPVLSWGQPLRPRQKPICEIALGSLKNLPADARIREDLEAVDRGSGQCLPAVQRDCIPASEPPAARCGPRPGH